MSSIFLNGKHPPYMESSEYLALSNGQIQHAVMSMTYLIKNEQPLLQS